MDSCHVKQTFCLTIPYKILWSIKEFACCFALQESFVEEALAQMEGSTLADMLDFLSKELIRLQVTKKKRCCNC